MTTDTKTYDAITDGERHIVIYCKQYGVTKNYGRSRNLFADAKMIADALRIDGVTEAWVVSRPDYEPAPVSDEERANMSAIARAAAPRPRTMQ